MPGATKSTELETAAKQMKRDIEGWREVVTSLHNLLTWQRPTDPVIIAVVTSLVFLALWYCDPSTLTLFALAGMLAAIADFAVPIVSAKVIGTNYWTAKREKHLDEVCRSLACVKLCAARSASCFVGMRQAQPTKFYLVTIVSLAFLFWIGNSVNNLLLNYLAAVTALLLPGLSHRGYLKPVRKVFSFLCCSKETSKVD